MSFDIKQVGKELFSRDYDLQDLGPFYEPRTWTHYVFELTGREIACSGDCKATGHYVYSKIGGSSCMAICSGAIGGKATIHVDVVSEPHDRPVQLISGDPQERTTISNDIIKPPCGLEIIPEPIPQTA